jgi:CIC family chloride channel protein
MLRSLADSDALLRFSLLAILTGLVAGLSAAVFRALIALFHNLLFLGVFSLSYDANTHTPASPWGIAVILVPVLGALAVTYLVKHYAPEAKGHGVPEVIDAIYYHGGVIRPTVAVIKSLASAISIGSGGAIGREGPIIQIGAAFGSTVGQLIPLPRWQRLTLIACGAGGGIAATFNTPIGGLLFAIELILPEISSRTLIPVALATGAATYVGRLFFGDFPAFTIPALALHVPGVLSAAGMLAWIGFGVLLVVSMIFIRALYGFEDMFERMPGNDYTRHALGMLLVGIMMYLLLRYTGHYAIQGVGYATIQDILQQLLLHPGFLLLLFALKLLATSLTLGSGASGGIFSPSLFVGATLGGAYALLLAPLIPGAHLDIAGTAVIGMAGMVAGATGAVVTAIVMIFEMTRDYNVIIPLMITASLAYGIRRALLRDSIYTMKLSRRGHNIPEALQTNLYLMHSARELLDVPMLRRAAADRTPLRKVLHARRRTPHILLVGDGRIAGLISADKVRRLDPDTGLSQLFATHGSSDFITVSADDSLFDVFIRLRDSRADIALVTVPGDADSEKIVIGALTWKQIAHASNLPDALRRRRPAPESR